MTEVLPAVEPEVMEALRQAYQAQVDAHARASVLAQLKAAKPKVERFYWGERDGSFAPVVDAVFGPGTWRAGMPIDLDVSPAVAARLSPGQAADEGVCQCQHCTRRFAGCKGNCIRCDDRTCQQCNPDGRLEDDDDDDGRERLCGCDGCNDPECQGEDCGPCDEYECRQCHPDLRDCCGYCERCDECHVDQRDMYDAAYCEHCQRCSECEHSCA